MEIYQFYINLLRNPFTVKNLKDLEQYYLRQGMTREANAFGKLVASRFQNDNHTPVDKERPEQN